MPGQAAKASFGERSGRVGSGLDGMVSRRWVLAGLLAGAAAPALAEAPASTPRPVPRPGSPGAQARLRASAPDPARLIAEARLGGAVGYQVSDRATGEVLEALLPEAPLPPASTTKAITTLYALEGLGAGFRFSTRLAATGPIAGGVVQGDLVLVGSGDPTLGTDQLAQMAARLRQAGVTGVRGDFLVDAGSLPYLNAIDPSQPDHVGYNPAIAGLNLNFNRVHFEWRRSAKGWDVAMDARSDLYVPPVRMARMTVVNRDLPVYTFAEEGGIDSWTVASTALGKGGSRWLPVRQPGAYAGDVFRTLARAQGVDLPEPKPARGTTGGTTLVVLESEPLSPILADMLKFSTNLTAEVVGLTTSGTAAQSLAASGARMGDWARAKYGRAGHFVDHSGLGADSRVAPADMVAAMIGARGGPLRGLMKPFPIRDANGKEVRNHPIRVSAKTGTLNFASGLVGYVETPGGRELAFAIYAADVPRRDALAPGDREQPPGGSAWARRARMLQSQLIERWSLAYG